MRYIIQKIVEAKSITQAIKKESEGKISSITCIDKEPTEEQEERIDGFVSKK